MKYLPTKPNSYDCVYERTIVVSSVNSYITSLQESAVETTNTLQTLSTGTGFYTIYSSPYSGAFSLLDTMIIPKPCATTSKNLT